MGGKLNQIKKWLRQRPRVRTWQLGLILVILLFIWATCLRFDHLRMVELRDAVLAADEAGDDAEISAALEKLKEFTFSHTVINVVEKNGQSTVTFGTGPFYLENQYLRKTGELLAQAEDNAGSDDNPNGNVFAAAMAVCRPIAIANGWTWNDPAHIECMTGEIAKYPTADRLEDTVVVSLPSTALYRYDFASPVFSWTLSGVMMIICAVLAVVILVRVVIWAFLNIVVWLMR